MSDSTIVTSPITAQATAFAEFVSSLDVEQLWQHSVAVDWETGEPTSEFSASPTDTHCSAFAAAVAKDVGIYLLQPPDHHPRRSTQEGQEFLANAQSFWLNGLYDPAGPDEPSLDDEEINPNLITASDAGWANVADRLGPGPAAFDLALEAQNLANAGCLVVASIFGNQNFNPSAPPPKGPGHIAVIMPANLTQDDLTRNGPAEAQAGDQNFSMIGMLIGFAGFLGFWYLSVEVWKLPRFSEMPGPTQVLREWFSRVPTYGLSIFVPESTRVAWKVPRSMVVQAPISTSSPISTEPSCGTLTCRPS